MQDVANIKEKHSLDEDIDSIPLADEEKQMQYLSLYPFFIQKNKQIKCENEVIQKMQIIENIRNRKQKNIQLVTLPDIFLEKENKRKRRENDRINSISLVDIRKRMMNVRCCRQKRKSFFKRNQNEKFIEIRV